jgi:hypothetical protein
MKTPVNYLMVLLLTAFLMVGLGCSEKYCESGDAQSCDCSDGTAAEQLCREDGTGWETCECTNYSIWCDDETDICWQDPQKGAYDLEDPGLTQPDALRYCEELLMGGYDDWRLPNIDELRTLVSGNPQTETGGECPMTEGSPQADMGDTACAPITEFGGLGIDGCYWLPELTGTCNRPDRDDGRPSAGRETVSSTLASDNPDWAGVVLFDNGAVGFNHIHSFAEVRCARDGSTTPVKCAEGEPEACIPGETRSCMATNGKPGAQACDDDGLCWKPCESTTFTPSPPIEDICDQCDQVRVTIKVPEKLAVKPKQVMAFLYEPEPDGSWHFPPGRPPDAGTYFNQVINPVIDVDKPLVMTVPACTYYRERCVSGEFYLLVYLLNSDKMPPSPTEGDYAWGMIQEPLTLGDGPQKMIEKEIMLVPCGEDMDENDVGDACES